MNPPPTGSGAPRAAVSSRRSWQEQLARRPLGAGLWLGLGLLSAYLAVAISALFEFRGSLAQLSTNNAWIPPFSVIGPSWSHPFGVLSGFGTDLFTAVWQATPWDLSIVAGILAIDAALGWILGALAGLNEGGALDAVVVFVGDTVGSIPSFFLVVAIFAGLGAVAPHSVGLPLFIVLFGLLIWPATARTTRERARFMAHQPFLESARASGAGQGRLLFRHILPNSVSPLLSQLPVDVAPIYFVLAVFPWFYDCSSGPHSTPGVPLPPYLVPVLPPYSPLPYVNFPEWGNLLGMGTCEGFTFVTGADYWWMYLFPLIAMLGLGIAIALVCDGIDRRMSRAEA